MSLITFLVYAVDKGAAEKANRRVPEGRLRPAVLLLYGGASCGVGLFGEDYFGFTRKPAPTTQKNLAVHFAVLLFGVACLLLWLSTGRS
jgi:uncharacterized membrane protein YsdA (DUF1294 family)